MTGVVSETDKAGHTRQVSAGKTNVSEPLMKCRKGIDVTETGLLCRARDVARWVVLAPLVDPRCSRGRAVLMVEASEHGDRRDRAGERASNAFDSDRSPLTDPLVRTNPIEVAQCIFSEDVVEMRL
jgi:hypothetical protein